MRCPATLSTSTEIIVKSNGSPGANSLFKPVVSRGVVGCHVHQNFAKLRGRTMKSASMIMRWWVNCLWLTALACFVTPKALAANPAPVPTVHSIAEPHPSQTAPTNPEEDEVVAPDSPRAAVADFLQLTRQQRFAEAARYLSMPAQAATRAPELAQKLKAVLESRTRYRFGQHLPTQRGLAQ